MKAVCDDFLASRDEEYLLCCFHFSEANREGVFCLPKTNEEGKSILAKDIWTIQNIRDYWEQRGRLAILALCREDCNRLYKLAEEKGYTPIKV